MCDNKKLVGQVEKIEVIGGRRIASGVAVKNWVVDQAPAPIPFSKDVTDRPEIQVGSDIDIH